MAPSSRPDEGADGQCLRMRGKGRELLQQDDMAERVGAEPLDDLIPVPDRDHDRTRLSPQPSGWR